MGEQPMQEHKIGELCTPDIVDLPILNLAEIGRPFEIKTSTIRMVQHSPFTGKEDPNLHLQAFIQLCQTFNMDEVTQDPMRARLFPFSLLGKALQVFHAQLAETVQNWNALMRAIMKEYYSPGKTQSLHNKIATFAQYPTESISEAFERFNEYTRAIPHHKFPKEDLVQKFYQGLTMASKTISMHRREGLSSSLRQPKFSLYSRRSRTMTRGRRLDVYFRFNPRGMSKESCKWRRKTYLKARSIHLCGGWRRWR
jgi:hypothetical protein